MISFGISGLGKHSDEHGVSGRAGAEPCLLSREHVRHGGAVASDAVDLLPFAEYAASLNRKRTAAGVLFRDERSRVLLVETTYKRSWEIPGGSVDADEPPWRTAVREVREETGLARPLDRLLLIDYIPADDPMPEGLAFVFDGGLITEGEVAEIELKDPEIRSVGLYTLEDVRGLVKPVLARRIEVALDAINVGDLALCESGHRVTAQQSR